MFLKFYLFIYYFWLHWVFIAARGLSLVAASRDSSPAAWSWHIGLVASQRVGSPWTRDQTRAPCIGRQILNPWTTRDALTVPT